MSGKKDDRWIVESWEADEFFGLQDDEDEEEERAPLSEEEKKKQEEEELKKKMEEEDQPDLENGLCAFMRLMDRVVRISASQLVTYSPEAQEFLKLGDFLFDSVEFNNVTLSKEAVTLATTFMHKVQLYELSQREVFVKSRTIWYPISSEHIGALIYMLSRIKCPRITPDCFEEAEQLIRKYCSDAHWEPVWSSIKERNINQQYRIEYTGRLPLFEEADFFAEDHYNDDSFYWNTQKCISHNHHVFRLRLSRPHPAIISPLSMSRCHKMHVPCYGF
ncbi:hypothetical protein L5515_019259 [Caenorhabditis briggsae]|uniref:Uncharacterized protein n=1 Tax=Caenorhabditis briggsae TaxID=6238 RepID=A0AAE9FEA5_CAEBR|nr:hypothetical protein L5515_019259 [Caenorhabditis briggsae]